MKKRALYSLCFLLSVIYSQEVFITESETASLIPENFVRNFCAQTDGVNDKATDITFKDMTVEQKRIRYTYETYDIYIKDIPEKAKQRFFGSTLLSEFGEEYGYNRRLAEPYYSRGFITYNEIVELLTKAAKDEYVLFDDRESLTSGVRFSLYKKLRHNKNIIGESAVGFSEGEGAFCPQMYIIECAFLNGEDRISFIKMYCYDWNLDIVSFFPEYFRRDTYVDTWAFISGKEQEQFREQIEKRSKRLPPWMLEFLDYYDKLYISVQNLFDMQLPLETTVFYTQANLNIRDKAGTDGTKLRMITKGTRLRLLEIGAKDKIDGITAPWVKVRLPDGTEGWCFSGYITAKKIYKAVLDRETPIIKNSGNGNKKLDSIDNLIIDNKMIRLGDKKPKGMISNTILEAPFMEFYKFGDIKGYESHDTIIGWNNMNAVIFITTVAPTARTQSGITIGSSRQEVVRAYGAEYLSTKNRMQYINNDFELVGMIFYFENNKVIRITCFTHI